MCSSSDAKQQPLQDGPGGIGEWQQEGLPLWVDLSEGGAAGQGNTGSPGSFGGGVGGRGAERGACRRPACSQGSAGLTWTACLCLSLSAEVPGGQLGTGVCVCGGTGGGGMWVGFHVSPGGPGRGTSEARAGDLAGLLFSPTEGGAGGHSCQNFPSSPS